MTKPTRSEYIATAATILSGVVRYGLNTTDAECSRAFDLTDALYSLVASRSFADDPEDPPAPADAAEPTPAPQNANPPAPASPDTNPPAPRTDTKTLPRMINLKVGDRVMNVFGGYGTVHAVDPDRPGEVYVLMDAAPVPHVCHRWTLRVVPPRAVSPELAARAEIIGPVRTPPDDRWRSMDVPAVKVTEADRARFEGVSPKERTAYEARLISELGPVRFCALLSAIAALPRPQDCPELAARAEIIGPVRTPPDDRRRSLDLSGDMLGAERAAQADAAPALMRYEDLATPTVTRRARANGFFQEMSASKANHIAALRYAADELERAGEAGTSSAVILLRQLATE